MVGGQRTPYRMDRWDGQLHDLHHTPDGVRPRWPIRHEVDMRVHIHLVSPAVAVRDEDYWTVMVPFMFMAACGVQM